MTWTFTRVERIEQRFGTDYALITLMENGVEESFYLKFAEPPTDTQAAAAGSDLAIRKNVEAAPLISRTISRQEFVGRFSLQELATIMAAAQSNMMLAAYLKKLEMYDTVTLDHDDVVGGCRMLETVGLLAPGRANKILGQ